MKKGILNLIIALLVTVSYAQAPEKNDLHQLDLKGNVKSVHQTWYWAKDNSGVVAKGKKICKDDMVESKILLNDKGNKTEDSRFNADGNLTLKLVYDYDDKGLCSVEDRYNSDGMMARHRKFAYKYDDAGKVIEEDFLGVQITYGKTTYTYDSKGNVIEKSWFNSDGTVGMKETSKYDDNGNMIETTNYVRDGKPEWRITYKMDASGKLAEETWYKNGTKFFITYTYSYDEQGRKTEMHYLNEKRKSYMKWTFKRVYDSHGNWTQEIQYRNDKPNTISERVIEYS